LNVGIFVELCLIGFQVTVEIAEHRLFVGNGRRPKRLPKDIVGRRAERTLEIGRLRPRLDRPGFGEKPSCFDCFTNRIASLTWPSSTTMSA
jgi:hypothetical protein